MKPAIRVLALILVLSLVAVGCNIQSKFKTRSYQTPEESQEISKVYNPPSEEPVRTIVPHLVGLNGPALRINGVDIPAEDIRSLYDYYCSYRNEDSKTLFREAAFEWIRSYAVATHWKDKIQPTVDRLNELRQQVIEGADFGNLIVENSMEPEADKTAGDLGTVGRGALVPIFEMHCMNEPLNVVSKPFPTVFGWHIIQVLSRDLSDPNNPKFHVRHLLLVHGLDPANGELIQQEQGANVMRWSNTAQVEILADELKEALPEYVSNSTDAGSGPATQVPAGGTE